MATKKGGAIGAMFATSSNTGERVGLHVIPIDSSGGVNPDAVRLDAISSVLGTVNDAAITAGSSGTISGKQRGLLTINADVWDSANTRIKVGVMNSPTVSPVAGSTWNVRPLQSSGNDLKVSESAGTGFTVNQVVLGSTAAQIVGANTARKRLLIIQQSTIDVYLGASTVTSTSGLLLAGIAGNQIVMRHTGAVSGISTGGSPKVSFFEETH